MNVAIHWVRNEAISANKARVRMNDMIMKAIESSPAIIFDENLRLDYQQFTFDEAFFDVD